MIRTTFTELRKKAASYFNAVERGEMVEVNRHGKTVAKIVPYTVTGKDPYWSKPITPLAIKGLSLSSSIIKERRRSKA